MIFDKCLKFLILTDFGYKRNSGFDAFGMQLVWRKNFANFSCMILQNFLAQEAEISIRKIIFKYYLIILNFLY